MADADETVASLEMPAAASTASTHHKDSLTFQDSALQEIDLRLTRKLSFNKGKEEVLVENTRLEECQLSEADLILAATLIKDAKAGKNMYFKTDEKSVKAYILFNHPAFGWTQLILQIVLLGLALFEKPALHELRISYMWTMLLETLILLYFLFRFFHHLYFDQASQFWKDPKNITVFILTMLTLVDILAYCIWVSVSAGAEDVAIRWSRIFRPLFLINFPEGRQIRKAFRNIRRTLPDIFYVLVLFIMSIGLFALMALKLFQKRNFTYPDGKPYFTDYFEAFWDLYVLVTTANNPDVMMPAYENSGWFAWFFIVYVLVNLYIFMSIVLAVVYNNYRKHLKNEVRCSVYLKRRILGRAFDILKVWREGHFVISGDRWHKVIQLVAPGRSEVQRQLLMFVLDENGNDVLEREEFLKLADLLNVPLTEVKDRMTFMEKYCSPCYDSKVSQWIKTGVRHRFFRYFFDFMILVNAFFIAFSVDEAEWFFLSIFVLEILLKLYAFGPVKFFRSFWNVFDLIVILAALTAILYESGIGKNDAAKERTLDFILVFRVLRLVRLMNSLPQFRVTLTTIVNIGPSIMTYSAVICVIFYMYAILGMELFGGLVQFYGHEGLEESQLFCGNPKLNGTEFVTKRYCKNNFNDITKAFVLLFELMVVNQWHVLTDGYVLVTNKAARLYFISFHLIVVVILLNIFTAFVLEAFLLEYKLSTSKLEDAIERKIRDMGLFKGQKPVGRKKKSDKLALVEEEEDPESEAGVATRSSSMPNGDAASHKDTADGTHIAPPGFDVNTGLRFKLRKSGAKKIEVLLHHMFEDEIDPTDEGPEENLDGFQFPESQNLTLNTVA